ncbi:3'-5' exonuclease [Alkalilimnicola sp. S0819]|uniref:3'-5' exonuclease n=1 Tax=Alkalilimnicola sp. S0819 TaxID=2613922 RepID=UPI0012624393|nr:3'-5' exonuclease [Alkalilimnicola sp. S0819]KAB7627566.1 3'-5' exonuclease [Alkalilimnicola sp. S0819]MPQ15723.1 3'-5' exonuclease [Alkalilimnicola sp. S0819]
MNIFVFDIETVPDVAGGRRLYGLDEALDDNAAAEAMFALRRQQSGGSDFLRLHLHRVVAISIAARMGERFKVWSLGEPEEAEASLIERFFDGVERYTPTLVSWNGSGFDLPVLHYRALHHGISAPRYWENGDGDREFRFNNYQNRFHDRHTDLMDVLACFNGRAAAPLDQLASLCGFPGKMGMSGGKVWEAFQAGEIGRIRDYCETDVLNTYLLYLRFQLMRGTLDATGYELECERVRDSLRAEGKPHLDTFLKTWQSGVDA